MGGEVANLVAFKRHTVLDFLCEHIDRIEVVFLT